MFKKFKERKQKEEIRLVLIEQELGIGVSKKGNRYSSMFGFTFSMHPERLYKKIESLEKKNKELRSAVTDLKDYLDIEYQKEPESIKLSKKKKVVKTKTWRDKTADAIEEAVDEVM